MHAIRRGSWYGVALFTFSGLLLAGCGSEFDEAPSDLEQRVSPSLFCNQPDGCCDPAVYADCAVSAKLTPSGYYVVVTTYTCHTTASSTAPSSTCRVNPTDYAIGGGAWALGTTDASPTSSLPIFGLGGGWKATSAGISGAVEHALRTYVIGFQIVQSNTFRNVNIANDIHRYDFSGNTGDPNRLGGSIRVAGGDLLIGGGWSAKGGVFAVDAYASGMLGGRWYVNGKQFRAGAASLSGVAIGLSRCMPSANPVVCFGPRDIVEAASPDGGFLQGAVVNNPHSEQFVVGVGAMSSSWDRPIWALAPLRGGGFGTPSQYGAGVAFTVAPTGASGHVTTQIMTMGF